MLGEAVRVLRPGGCVAVFEGDYATATLATRAGDPLDTCAEAFREGFVHDPWLVRRLPGLVRAAGLQVQSIRSYGYVEVLAPGFMLGSWVDMGADALAASGRADPSAAAELKAEARRRIASGGVLRAHCVLESRRAEVTMTATLPNKLMKLTAAGFCRAGARVRHGSW